MNIIAISGHLTADPELRSTQSGVPVASFRVGVRRKFSKDDKSDFFNVEAWRSNAEFVAKYFHKGKPIDIEGHLETGPWTDKNGSRHDGVKIVAERVSFSLGDRPRDQETQNQRRDDPPAEDPSMPDDFDPFANAEEDSEDLPF